MGAALRPEGEISTWTYELSYDDAPNELARWDQVFAEHAEFFVTYQIEGRPALKAALRWRYTNRLYDAQTGITYTQAEKEALPQEAQWLLTTKPLPSDAIGTLMNTAIELHGRALEELSSRRWWVPVFAAGLGFVGAVLGGAVVPLLVAHTSPRANPALHPVAAPSSHAPTP